jgi:hypothetical protein
VLVFVEVRGRKHRDRGAPEETVGLHARVSLAPAGRSARLRRQCVASAGQIRNSTCISAP